MTDSPIGKGSTVWVLWWTYIGYDAGGGILGVFVDEASALAAREMVRNGADSREIHLEERPLLGFVSLTVPEEPTREERYRGWRKQGFGSDEAHRRADMPGIEPTSQTNRSDTAEITVVGPVNGMDEPDATGSYLRVCIATRSGDTYHRISRGAAEILAAEIFGAISHDN